MNNGVSTVIPGCASPGEIEEILTYYTCPGDMLDYSAAVAKSRWSVKGNCLYCGHCLPCSAGIDIAGVNKLLDSAEGRALADMNNVLSKYRELTAKASDCIQCRECENRCPFDVEIIERMKRAAEIFEGISM